MVYKLIPKHAVSRNGSDKFKVTIQCRRNMCVFVFSEKCNDAECKTCAVEATSSEKKCKVCNAKFITTDATNGGECKGRFWPW